MKQLLFILFSFAICNNVFAQNTGYGRTVSTPSEAKASIIITKVSETMTLSQTEINQLVIATGEYWDNLEGLKGQRKYEEKLAKRVELFNSTISTIFKDEERYSLYQKKFAAVLESQRAGYGRRR